MSNQPLLPPRETQPVFKDTTAAKPTAAKPSAVNNAVKKVENNIPMATLVGNVVGDVAGDIDPIGPLIQKINPENITALSKGVAKIVIDTGTATSVIMDATGRLINNAGAVVGSLVKGTTEIISTAGTVIGNISKESLNTLKAMGIKAMGEVGKVVDTAIKAGSEIAKEVVKEYGDVLKTGINQVGESYRDTVDKGSDVAKSGISGIVSAYQTKKKADTIKSIAKYALIAIVVIAVIIIIVVLITSKPKKMTNNMSTPMNFNPEAQSYFTEREYKYYNELVI